MATFTTESNPVAPPDYKNVVPSFADEILGGTDNPVQHPYAPPTIGTPNYSCVPDSNTWEVYPVNCGSGPISDQLVQMKVPRSMLILRGNDQGGSITNVLISFVPLGNTGVPGTPSGSSAMTSAIGFQNFQVGQTGGSGGSTNSFGVIKFCKPITRFYVNSADSGQPNSNTIIWATDDLDFLANGRQ